MNTPNPLVPQGTIPSRGRSHVRIAVFTILGIHVVLLGALLLQGCGRTSDTEVVAEATNDTMLPPWAEPTNTTQFAAVTPQVMAQAGEVPPTPVATPPISAPPAHVPPAPGNPGAIATPTSQPVFVPAGAAATPGAGAASHVVLKNESYYTIAKKYNVTIKAITDANPGIEPSRLKPGQKLNIPAPSASVAGHAASNPGANAPARAGGNVYVVKSGDTLGKIAKAHGTTAAKLRAANNLTTDRIAVGRSLVLPPRTAGGKGETAPVPAIDTATPAPRFPGTP